MNVLPSITRRFGTLGLLASLGALALVPTLSAAPMPSKDPVGKLYVVAVDGGARVTTAGKIVPLHPKTLFVAQGSEIETKPRGNLAVVFSNGTGASLSPDTDLEVRRFTQEAFTASRSDLEREPSISHTEVFIPHGTLAVSTSKLLPRSTLVFITAQGSVTLHEGNLVVEADANSAKFFLLAGDATVHGGNLGPEGEVLHAGEQAVFLPGRAGQPWVVQISALPAGDRPALEALVEPAYAARRTVFFETGEDGEITGLPVVPATLPVQASISPSKLPN
jgi:hypothetical protein